MTVTLLTNVRAVLPDRVTDTATIAIEDGLIVGVEPGRSYAGAADGKGAFCMPGVIDTHSDAIEKEITPRPAVELDESFALRSLESRIAAWGITTTCHGIGFEDGGYGRTIKLARRLVEVIGERRQSPGVPLDHRILYRVPARSADGLDVALDSLDVGQGPGEPPILSFEDHTPGQGQFRDLKKFRQYLVRSGSKTEGDVDGYIAERMAEGEAAQPIRDANLARISKMALDNVARVLVHDCEEAPEMKEARAWGAAVAEFPLTVGAARAARDHGMPVVMGAPNVVRGGSHSGNVNAAELIGRDLCTSLASDYLPSSLLAAVFLLVEQGVTTLNRAVALVTSGPAKVLGLADRGELRVGARADLALVALDGRWPRVLQVVRTASSNEDAGLTLALTNAGVAS